MKIDMADRFHKHLDRCKQCRENPFDLCSEGVIILSAFLAQNNIAFMNQSLLPATPESQAQREQE